MGFCHLHLHTEYSLLDGACPIEETVIRAKELGMTSAAITDHGVMYGVIDFFRAAKKYAIKPIIGCEVYVARRTRFDKEFSADRENYHLILLCKDMTGYKNLIKLVSLAYIEGFYGKPRIDLDLLKSHSKGIIALSACLSGRVPSLILNNELAAAEAEAMRMKSIFGGDYYFELQNHGMPDEMRVNAVLASLSKKLSIPMVATNDVHYLKKSDARSQEVLMCIQTGTTLDDDSRMKLPNDEFYLKSPDEMAALFEKYPEAIENTEKIADMCSLEFSFDTLYLPGFEAPDGKSAEAYLRECCEKGLEQRLSSGAIAASGESAYRSRMEYELSVIIKMGFCEYFLIVSDFVNYAKNKGIYVGPGRGSGAGSLCAFALRITDIDPIKYGLLFERFLNPERVSMPDFDIDFCYERRHEVIEYVAAKYGEDHVSQIITFNTMASRAVVRDVGRVLGMSYADVDEVAKAIPHALDMTLDKALAEVKEFRHIYDDNADAHRLIDIAKTLEGMPRHASMHAAGVVITDKPVMEYVPLAVNSGVTVTQFPMNTIADIGLLKMDFLGLRYLTVIRDAVELIRYKNPGFSIENIPYDDAETFDMISAGRNAGVFQLESGGMTSLCVQMKPRNIEDITAAIALYRPGPMDSIPKYLENRKNADAIKYDVPAFKNILGVTYGCIVYQEQVMQIFRELAGYSYGRADLVRRAMSKKKQKEMEKEREYFLHGKTVLSPDGSGVIEECYGALKYGLDEDTANKIFNEMAEFAKYAFNKSHAAAYSIITYRTAYLKCRFPSEYLAARLSAALIDGKVPFYMAECAKSGIPVLPPDINESNMGFSAITREGKPAIRFGLLAVKNVGEGFIHDMFIERASRPFSDFADFIMRMSVAGLNRKTVESLVLAGAFDSFGIERNRLVAVTENAINSVARSKKQNISGQLDLFADRSGYESAENNGGGSLDIEYPALPPLSEKEKLALEREVCGMYLSGHPMYEYADIPGVTQISYLSEENSGIPAFSDGDAVTLCGMITSKKIKPAKNNSRVAFVELEDLSGKTELILFESVLAKCEKLLYDESIVTVAGTVSTKGDEIKILARSVVAAKKPGPRNNTDIGSAGTAKASDISSADKYAEKPENVNFQASDKIYLRLPSKGTKIEKRIMALLDIFEGSTPVIVYYGDEKKSYRLSGLGCAPDDKLIAELRHLAGEDNVVYKQS